MEQQENIKEVIHASKADENCYKITMALLSVFSDKDNPNYIDINDMSGEEGSELLHSVLNTAPNKAYSFLTHKELDPVELNHLANKLVFKYTERGVKGEE